MILALLSTQSVLLDRLLLYSESSIAKRLVHIFVLWQQKYVFTVFFCSVFLKKYRSYEALFCVQTILLYGVVKVPDFKLSRMTLMYLVQLTVFIYSSFVLGM